MGLSNSKIASSVHPDIMDRVPLELKDRCLEFAAAIDTPTAYAVCLTNRYGRKVGQRALYRSISISGDANEEDPTLMDDRLRRWSLLCRTLCQNRVLARQVREMNVYIDRLDGVSTMLPPPLDVDFLQMMVEADLGLTFSQQERFWAWFEQECAYYTDEPEELDEEDDADADESGYPDGIPGKPVIVKLEGNYSCLRSTEELNFALRPEMSDVRSTQAAHPFADGIGNLQEVYFANRGEDASDDETSVYHVISALNWPSLRKMSIRSISGMGPILVPSTQIHSRLQELHIESVMVDDQDHIMLLNSCPQLRSLSLAWHDISDVYRRTNWRALGESLQRTNHLLEDLRIDIAHKANLREEFVIDGPAWNQLYEADHSWTPPVNNMGIGSLAGLRHLRRLAIPKVGLFGVFDDPVQRDRHWTLADVLPHSVEEVDIFCEGVDLTDDDRGLLAAPGTARLRDITIFNCTRDRWISKKHGEGSA